MSTPPPGWSDQQVEQTIGNLLRWGLFAATTLVSIGAVIYLFNHASEQPAFGVFHGEPPNLRGLEGILVLVFEWRGRGFIQLGLLVLLATPVLRVAFSVVAFTLQRDPMYVSVTLVVLAVLVYSIFGGEM